MLALTITKDTLLQRHLIWYLAYNASPLQTVWANPVVSSRSKSGWSALPSRGLESQASIREYFSLLTRKIYITPGTVLLANSRWALVGTEALQTHWQRPYMGSLSSTASIFRPVVMGQALVKQPGVVNPVVRDPSWWRGAGGVLQSPVTKCPEFIAALTLQGRTSLLQKPEGR